MVIFRNNADDISETVALEETLDKGRNATDSVPMPSSTDKSVLNDQTEINKPQTQKDDLLATAMTSEALNSTPKKQKPHSSDLSDFANDTNNEVITTVSVEPVDSETSSDRVDDGVSKAKEVGNQDSPVAVSDDLSLVDEDETNSLRIDEVSDKPKRSRGRVSRL